MDKGMKIEVEDRELFLVNEAGDKVIIPKDKAAWVKEKLKEGCHGCIDKLVETLPVMEDYADDGSLIPDDKKEITFKYKPYTAVQDNTYVAPKVITSLKQKEKQQFISREQPVLKADTRTEQQRKRAQEYTESVLNPSISTQIGEALQKPLRWLADPVKGVGDIVSAIAPNSALAKNLPNTNEDVFEYRKKQLNPYTSNKEKINNTINEAVPLTNWASLNILPVEAAAGNMIKSSKNLIKPASKVLNKTDDVVKTVASSVDDVSKSVKPAWQMQELPGLHLKSTMEGGAISKIVDKTGKVNTEQALAIIGKESGGKEKVELIRKGFGDNIPPKMDYNEFRKTVQDQLIPLERQFSGHASNYGIHRLGYSSVDRNTILQDIANDKIRLQKYLSGELKPPTEWDINILKHNIEYKEQAATELLENQTLILGNKGKFGRGSSAHGNPEETLGHIHFLRDAETPDVLTVTQIQSDAFQGTHRIMPKSGSNPKIDKWEKMLTPEGRKELVEIGGEEAADLAQQSAKEFLEKAKKEAMDMLGPNPIQKRLLDKNHQERFLQEFVDYAAKRGDVNKIRVPTPETAAKVQGYSPSKSNYKLNDEIVLKDGRKGKLVDEEVWEGTRDFGKPDIMKVEINGKIEDIPLSEIPAKFTFSSEHQTILKKYAEQPKTIKKLFGTEPKVVTDSKGNTWYEFDIPKKFKEGKGEIKAFGLIPPAIGIGTAIQSQQNKSK